jgi:hypothetical protein
MRTKGKYAGNLGIFEEQASILALDMVCNAIALAVIL